MYSKFKNEHPQSSRIRNHDHIPELLHLLHINNINNLIANCNNLHDANETFKRVELFYADKTIPVKTVINKKSGKPFLTDTTKDIIKEKIMPTNNSKSPVHQMISASTRNLQTPYRKLLSMRETIG